jgi:FAD/FMN-containing dehydrogenase
MTTIPSTLSDELSPTLQIRAIDDLKSKLRGPLIFASDPGYEESRTVWNGMIDRRPAMVVKCLGVNDVVACVNFARANGIALSVKGGGHNIAGLAVTDQGLLLDMSLMRGVWVDPVLQRARAQAGCLLGDVDRETQVHGLATTLGFISNTGIAGLTLGGGFGYLTRRYGWTSDQLVSMEVVTAEGRVLRTSDRENSDLFWGLRGGGGNFGIVTSFEYRLHSVGPEVVAGAVAWRGEDAPAVLDLYRRLVADAPPEMTCIAVLRIAPPAPWIAKEMHGKPMVALFACHSGKIEDGERLVAPIKAFGSPIGDILQRRTYISQQTLLDATQPKGRRYYWKSEFMSRIDPAATDAAMEHAKSIVSPHSAIIFFALDGALNRLSNEHSAVGNRNAHFVLNITGAWDKAEDDAANIEWARSAWRDMRRFSTGGTYVNFLTEEEAGDRIQAAYGRNYERLVDIKTKWDPKNLFRANKNIAPRD